MDILVLSDSHGRSWAIARVMEQINFRPAAILFLGDGIRDLSVLSDDARWRDIPLYTVKGNCDGFNFCSLADDVPEQIVILSGHRIMMMHGDRFGVRSGFGAAAYHAACEDADVLLYGHTHVPFEETVPAGERIGSVTLKKPLLVANPGSIGSPREGGEPSFGVLTFRGKDTLFSHGILHDNG